MAYLSLYRKYRSQDFDSIVGQKHVVQTLKNAIQNNRLAHAYIFSGPRGTGKTSMARILAKSLNCEQGKTVLPCLDCHMCRSIKSNSAVDIIEIDAASNRGIDEIRQLRDQVNFVPVEGRYKVYIIDEVHMLTMEAFNALLKTLEEPPAHTVFVLATTEVKSNENSFLFCKNKGTSSFIIRKAKPSTIEVFPTPGSPIKTGLFFFLLLRI